MSKKAATARSRVQRSKPKAQKAFELVRPESVAAETEEIVTASGTGGDQAEPKVSGRGSTRATVQEESKKASERVATAEVQARPEGEGSETKAEERRDDSGPRGASARIAARRQANLRLQQRAAPALITSEHFAYVRKDLIRIAVFAVIMFTAIIVLYFVLGRA